MTRSAKKTGKKWTASEKLRVVMESAALSEKDLGEFLRREGLHEADVKQWRETAETALGGGQLREKRESAARAKQVKTLERELRRKEKALAEAAALLVLKKKVREIWGDEDDSTQGRSEE